MQFNLIVVPHSSQEISVSQLVKSITGGDRSALARAITLCESTLEADRMLCESILPEIMPITGNSIRIGITGVPGVGKSTFIEAFGELATAAGNKVAVLAIDPTSQKTKGSIMGDKTRMDKLSKNANVFIRPSPSGSALGGVSFATRETILLCEAAGFNVIIVETVGVGQSETYVRSMTDFFLLLMLAGAGDELQGIKKGIMEMADLIAINKADGANVKASLQARADVQNALHLLPESESGWRPKVTTISAIENKGIDEVWNIIQQYKAFSVDNGFFNSNRESQKRNWLDEAIDQQFQKWKQEPGIEAKKKELLSQLLNNKLLPSQAAREFWKVK